jgi:hypothetical protein
MSKKLKLWLPLVQVLIAVVLVMMNARRPHTWGNPTWKELDIQLCHALNAPATVVLLFPYLISQSFGGSYYLVNWAVDKLIYFALVWLLWYMFSVRVTGGRIGAPIAKSGLRRATSTLASLFGVGVGVYALIVMTQFGGVEFLGLTDYGLLLSVPYLVWAVIIVKFYSRDLRASFR